MDELNDLIPSEQEMVAKRYKEVMEYIYRNERCKSGDYMNGFTACYSWLKNYDYTDK